MAGSSAASGGNGRSCGNGLAASRLVNGGAHFVRPGRIARFRSPTDATSRIANARRASEAMLAARATVSVRAGVRRVRVTAGPRERSECAAPRAARQ
jgi:hypothetical protein